MRAKVVVVLSMAALAACTGTSSGNPILPGTPDTPTDEVPDRGGETAGSYPHCERDPSPLGSLDEPTPLGFSATDVLAFVEGTHASRIRWNGDGFAEVGPERGEQDVTIAIARGDGEARYVALREREPNEGELLTDIGLPQTPCEQLGFVEIELGVHIATGGGALDEHARGTLQARRADFASISMAIDAEDVAGTLEVGATRGGFVLHELTVDLKLSPLGLRGGVGGTFVSPEPPSGNSGAQTGNIGVAHDPAGAATGGAGIASIGLSASCDPAGLPIGDDQELAGMSAADVIALMNAAAGLGVRFSDGTASSLELGFAHDGQAVCAVIDPWALDAPDDPGKLQLGGALAVASADGRVDGEWPVRLDALASPAGGVEQIAVTLVAPNFSEPGAADLEAEYGIHGVDAAGHDGVYVMLELTVTPAGDGASAAGGFKVQALDMVECPADPDPNDNATPGCRGADITDLLSATITEGGD